VISYYKRQLFNIIIAIVIMIFLKKFNKIFLVVVVKI